MDRLRRLLLGVGICAVLFVAAVRAPIPVTGNPPLDRVLDQVSQRLPGWQIAQATEAWENGYVIVARCAGSQLAFQLFPHGLPPGDHWVQAQDEYTRSRVAQVSDLAFRDAIVWRADPIRERSLSCREETYQTARFLRERGAW